MMKRVSLLIGGILLIAGTTIGAGMLALPISTGIAGFIPAVSIFAFCWIYLTYTAFLMLEVNLWMEPNTNLVTMAKRTLGWSGKLISWIVYLLLLYLLTTAYLAASSPIFVYAFQVITGYTIPKVAGVFPLLLIFGYFVYRGTAAVDYANRTMMIGLAISYFLIIFMLIPYINLDFLDFEDWSMTVYGIPIVVTSFGFHIIIPTLSTYLNRDVPLIVKAILIGSIIPLLFYIFWNFVTLGTIPLHGEVSIYQGYQEGTNASTLLASILTHSPVRIIAQFLAFFVIITSFLGVSLSLHDFLADGFKIPDNHKGKFLLYCLTFIPPLLFTFTDPRAFLDALEYAGVFGVIVLLGLLPAIMAWVGRYHKNMPSTYQVPGGKTALIVIMIVSLFMIGVEIRNKVIGDPNLVKTQNLNNDE